MKKLMKRISICLTVVMLIWGTSIFVNRDQLNTQLIRLHVVANSDSYEDQSVKLLVRDAIVGSLQDAMADVADIEAARTYIYENLPQIQKIANDVLRGAGVDADAVVSLAKESFDTRYYDTFRLPAGVYESLRITIGEGEGRNWWCVVFPTLCLPATSSGFEAIAAGAGFDDALTAALEGKQAYEIRFFLLDALGRVENMFFKG